MKHDPFAPENHPPSDWRPQASKSQSAAVKWRIKGQPDGPVYQGQEIVKPCGTCGGSSAITHPEGTEK